MTRSPLASALLLAMAVLCGACVSEQDAARADTVVADDGQSLLVVVIKSRHRTTRIVYSNTVAVGPNDVELWLVPPQSRADERPRLLRTLPLGNPFPDRLYGMLSAGYVYIHTMGEGRYLLDISSGEIRPISPGGEEHREDLYIPSRDGRYLAHFDRGVPSTCEDGSQACVIALRFLDTATLAVVTAMPVSLVARDPSTTAEASPRFDQRVAWTAGGTLRVSHGDKTIDIGVDGGIRDVPYEPCYYAPTSSGRVSLSGEHFAQAVNADGEFTSLTSSNIFDPLDDLGSLSFGCVVPVE